MNIGMICPKGKVELQVLVMVSVIDNFLENLYKCFIWCLNLTVALRVVRSGPFVLEMEVIIESLYFMVLKGVTIIVNNRNGNTIAIDDMIKYEFWNLLIGHISEREGFYPLSEVFNVGCIVLMAIGGGFYLANVVESPFGERPRKRLWRCMN